MRVLQKKLKEAEESGNTLLHLKKVYCPVYECVFSDYYYMSHQFDNKAESEEKE